MLSFEILVSVHTLQAINLIYFFTCGETEVKCWQVRGSISLASLGGLLVALLWCTVRGSLYVLHGCTPLLHRMTRCAAQGTVPLKREKCA